MPEIFSGRRNLLAPQKFPQQKIKKRQFSFEAAVTKSLRARISRWMNIPIAETTDLRAVSAI
jgi:hypothetical protein